MSTYQTQGLILSNRDFREADKFFSIYTDTHGKIEALACGVRKIKSKLRAHLEPFSVVNLMIAHGHRHDRLIGAISQKSHNGIKSNYKLLVINYQLLEIIDQLTKLNHPDPRIFNLLKEVFNFPEDQLGSSDNITIEQYNNREIEKSFQSQQLWSVHSYFIIRLLSYLGYTPELKICVRCKKPVNLAFKTQVNFSYHDGSVICEKCHIPGDQPVSPESIKILQNYLIRNLQENHCFGNEESYKISQGFLNYHLDQPLKSVNVK